MSEAEQRTLEQRAQDAYMTLMAILPVGHPAVAPLSVLLDDFTTLADSLRSVRNELSGAEDLISEYHAGRR